MENLSSEQAQPSLAAMTEKVEDTSLFDRGGAEHLRLPCAVATPVATEIDRVCPINNYLPICNELLFHTGMELRQQRGGFLSLVCFRPGESDVLPLPPGADLYRSNTFLRWLLKGHICIASLKLQHEWVTAHSRVILDELPENSRLKKLRVEFPAGDTAQTHFAKLLPRLRCLEELYLYMSPSTDVLVAAVITLLRTTTCLTSLVFHAHFQNSQPPKVFIDALAANTTLKSLDMWANWNSDEPPGTLGEYMKGNGLLTKLVLFGEETDREELLLDVALVSNCTLAALDIGRLCGGERTVRFLTRILAECTSLKKLTLGGLRDEYVYISEGTLTRCVDALADNVTLEELTLSYSLWHSNNWIAFFAFLPRNQYLKKLEVSDMFSIDHGTHAPVLEALAQTDSLGRVSFGCYMHDATSEEGLLRFRAFSEINIYGDTSAQVNALQRLSSFDHFTSVTISLFEADQRLFDSVAKYIQATTMLRKLSLLMTNPAGDAPSPCWMLLFESILANTSIADLWISACDIFSYTGHLARLVGLSRCITRVSYSKARAEWDPTSFIMPLSEAIWDNYNLLKVDLSSTAKVFGEARRCWFTIRETTRRNSDLVELASAFNQTTALNWYTANALEKVSQHPALLRELAEKEGIVTDEVASMIRSRLRTVEGLHDFMRLTGVVKGRVICAPRVHGCSVQLQDLDTHCWRIVRRYLSFDDVKSFTVGKPDDSVPSCTTGSSRVSRGQ